MLEFKAFEGSSSPFKRTISAQAWASEVKTANAVPSLTVSNILQGKTADAKYAIVTLSNGHSATVPVSKKAVVGSSILDYKMAETTDGGWIVVTGSADGITL